MSSVSSAVSVAFKTARNAGGVSIRYSRGDHFVDDLKVLPSIDRESGEAGRAFVVAVDLTIRVLAEELIIANEVVLPERGDRITLGNDHFEVAAIEGGKFFEYADPYRFILRVYAKQVK